MRKKKQEKEGFVVMTVEFLLVSGCIQSCIQINNLDVWGFFFLRSDVFPSKKGMFSY